MSLQNCHVKIQTGSISKCDLVWRQGLYRSNQVKMTSMTSVPLRTEGRPGADMERMAIHSPILATFI